MKSIMVTLTKKLATGVLALITTLNLLASDNVSFEKKGNVELKPVTFIHAQMQDFADNNFICEWVWPEHTVDVIDSHLPFIFRTKKSAELEELKILVNINNKGKVVGFDMLTENVDKGTKERVAHVLRKLPNAQPVPGFTSYNNSSFELFISY